MRYLIFKLGNRTFALPGERVHEVVRLLLLGPAPGRVYAGSIPWRGRTLAVLGSDALGVGGAVPKFAIVTEVFAFPEEAGAKFVVGFPAERATGIADADELSQAPPGSDSWLAGILEQEGAWVIDPDKVIGPADAAEAALALGEEEFIRFCAEALRRLAEKRGSRHLEKAALALEAELKRDETG